MLEASRCRGDAKMWNSEYRETGNNYFQAGWGLWELLSRILAAWRAATLAFVYGLGHVEAVPLRKGSKEAPLVGVKGPEFAHLVIFDDFSLLWMTRAMRLIESGGWLDWLFFQQNFLIFNNHFFSHDNILHLTWPVETERSKAKKIITDRWNKTGL